MDVGEHAALRDGDAREELVQLFIVPKKKNNSMRLCITQLIVGGNMWWLLDCFNLVKHTLRIPNLLIFASAIVIGNFVTFSLNKRCKALQTCSSFMLIRGS